MDPSNPDTAPDGIGGDNSVLEVVAQTEGVDPLSLGLGAELPAESRPAGYPFDNNAEAGVGGSMLDNSVVLLCTEVCDGNTHLHENMPFVVAGKAGGSIETGRVLDAGGQRHAGLLAGLAHAMGEPIGGFGDTNAGPLPGLLS